MASTHEVSRAAPEDAGAAVPRAARVRADLALLVVTAIWGGTFAMVKDALNAAGPFTFLALRFAIATAAMVPFLALARGESWRVGRAAWIGGGVLGVVLYAGFGFQTAGLQWTTPARAAFVTGLSVVIVPLFAAAFLGRSIRPRVWTGVVLALLGMALLSLGPDVFSGGAWFSTATAVGDLLVIGCALAFALHITLVGEYAPRHGDLPLSVMQFAVAALLAITSAFTLERPTLAQVAPILPAAAFTGLLATAGAFVVQVRAQRQTTATRTALVFSAEPVFGALFAYLLVGETLGPAALAGCALILAGMLVAQLAD